MITLFSWLVPLLNTYAQNIHIAVMYFCLTFQLSCTTNMGNTNISLTRSAQIHQRPSALMPLCALLFKKLIVPHLIQRFTTKFTEVQLWFQTKPVHDLQSFSLKIILITSQQHLGLLSRLLQVFLPGLCMHFLSLPCVYAPPISSILILSPSPTPLWWGHLHATISTLADIQWTESNCKQYKCLFYITTTNNL